MTLHELADKRLQWIVMSSRKSRIALLLLVVVLASFARSDRTIEFPSDILDAQAEVARHIPPGTRIEQARRLMEYNGFACRSYAELFHTPLTGPVDYLYCDRDLVKQHWLIAVTHVGGVVTNVSVTHMYL